VIKPVTIPHPNSYLVPDSRLIAGEYPFTPVPAAAREKLRTVLDAGVTVFVDLTHPPELDPYEHALREEGEARRLAIQYHRLPIVDNDVPEPERMAEILDTIAAAEAAGCTVYVHCWGGVGRTGTVVGCYLVRKGISGANALEQVQALFSTMSPEKLKRHAATGSPQTGAQREFIRGWSAREPHRPRETPTEFRARRMVERLLQEHGGARAALLAIERSEEDEGRERSLLERFSGSLGEQAAREEAKARLRELAAQEPLIAALPGDAR
jgi:hypothetical protein